MNLTIDIGNSLTKLTLIEQGQVVDFIKTKAIDTHYLLHLLHQYPHIEGAILISSRGVDPALELLLRERMGHYLHFDASTPIPLCNSYRTPETLGPDRLAAAVGAHTIYPDAPVLVVDLGTAITIDCVTAQGEFLGGNISPGATTRFRALHHFTHSLPLLTLSEETSLLGDTSTRAIHNGVINGIMYEIEGYIGDLERRFAGLRIIFTGGDGNFFAKRLKYPIFVTYDLVAYGLNRILDYNAKS